MRSCTNSVAPKNPYEDRIQRLLDDPTCSFWLRKAVMDLSRRDAVDAVADAEILLDIANLRLSQVTEEIQAIISARAK